MSKNKKGRTQRAAAEPVRTADAFSNPLFRLGFGSQSPLEATEYPLTRLTDNYALLNSLYRSAGICRSVVSIVPNDMTRRWYELRGIGPEAEQSVRQAERSAGLRDSIDLGLQFGSLYGGAAGLIRVRGQEGRLEEPLDLEAVLPGAFEGVQILDRWTGVTPEERLVFTRGRMLPEYYRVDNAESGIHIRVHHSRIIRFTSGHGLACSALYLSRHSFFTLIT